MTGDPLLTLRRVETTYLNNVDLEEERVYVISDQSSLLWDIQHFLRAKG
jgi:hypothetical protein